MAEGVSEVDAIQQNRFDRRTMEPDEVAARVRQLAIEAHRLLNLPDTPDHELMALRRRFKELLRDSRGSHPRAIDRWLHSAQHRLDARLLSRLRTDPSELLG